MSVVRIIGDVHGKFRRYREIIRGVPFSIQAGDMGVGFRRQHADFTWRFEASFDTVSGGRGMFMRGGAVQLPAGVLGRGFSATAGRFHWAPNPAVRRHVGRQASVHPRQSRQPVYMQDAALLDT